MIEEGSRSTESAATLHEDGWIRVKVPLPFSLRYVNAYLIPGEEGYTLVDPGLRTSVAEEVWMETLRRHGIAMQDITRIILTHQHPDHYGLAGWFQVRTSAPVYMSERSHAYARRLWGEGRTFAADLTALYARHGMPKALLDTMEPHLESFVDKVEPQPSVTYIRGGDTLAFGGGEWEMIPADGHASGQLCFYQAAKRIMLCGDQVLPDITPNVSVVPGEPTDVLRQFLDSLEQLSKYDVRMAFPGHRDPFADWRGRIAELTAHHVRRLDQMADLLVTPTTAYEVCTATFGQRIAGNAHNLRFAMSETLAHLEHLVLEGRAVLMDKEAADGIAAAYVRQH
jgi:glyoxylase-like metal-dependent hydrolase (beta-lactamase superfamily II)